MNRNERRKAKRVLLMNVGDGGNYLTRVTAALENGTLPMRACLMEARHDKGCGILRGAECDCNPVITVMNKDCIIEIDSAGIGHKRPRQ